MAQTRKKREAEQAQAVILSIFVLVLGLFFMLFWRSPWGLLPFAAGAGLVALQASREKKRKQALLNLGIRDLDALTWEQFEELLQTIFHRQGFKARLTPNGADFGADLVIERSGERVVVQAKHWSHRDVGVKAVQEVAAAKPHYEASGTLVVTTGYFTAPAVALAKSNRVELWDRDRLEREIVAVSQLADGMAPREPLAVLAPQPEMAVPEVSCPACGSTMVERWSQRGSFWGCSRFPQCRGTRPG